MERRCSECNGICKQIGDKIICSGCGRTKNKPSEQEVQIEDMNDNTKDYDEIILG